MRSYIQIISVLSFLLLVGACKKDNGVLGVEVQPGEDGLNASYLGDLSVTAYSMPYDSIATFYAGSTYFNSDSWKYIGSNNDPHFGKTDVGLYVNAHISATDLNFGADAKLVYAEIILVLDNDWVGDKTTSLTYSVFPLDSVLNYERIYYSTNTRLHNKTMISAYTCTYTSMIIPGSSSSVLVPVLRIRLDTAYANALLHDTPNLTNNEVFQAKYKGYYISSSLASGSEGTIFKTDVDHEYTGLHLFYKRDASPNDTVDFNFKFKGSNQVRFNTVKFQHNANLTSQFADTSLGATNMYLKGLGNTKLKVQIPFLQNYSDSFQISVNRAELIFNVDPTFVSSGNYTRPPKLSLLAIDSLGREIYIEDQKSVTDYIRYGGNYDSYNYRYVFNIAREAQMIFRGQKKNRGFYLVVANTDSYLKPKYNDGAVEMYTIRRDNYVERVILAGSNNAALKPKLNLSYVKFKND